MSPWIQPHTHTSYYSFLFWISISVSVSATEMLGEKPVSRLALVTAWQSIGIVVSVLFFYFFRSLAFFRPLVAFMLMSSTSSSSRRSIWLLPQLLTTRANKTVDCRLTLGHHQSVSLCTFVFLSLSLSFSLAFQLTLFACICTFFGHIPIRGHSLQSLRYIYIWFRFSFFFLWRTLYTLMAFSSIADLLHFLSFDLTSAQCIQNI